MNVNDFSGAKIAVIAKGHILALHRDDIPTIPYPDLWDLPGGGRENQESPIETALRELFEETGLRLLPNDICWRRIFASTQKGQLGNWFMVARPGWLTLPALRLSNEGQDIRWMKVDEYLGLENAIPHMQERLRIHLDEMQETEKGASNAGGT